MAVDTASTFCYLLSQEEHRDADAWSVRLVELADRGFAPDAIVADFGSGLRAGQQLALPDVPCRGDIFHLLHDLAQVLSYLENRAMTPSSCANCFAGSKHASNDKAGPRKPWASNCGVLASPATQPSRWRTMSGRWENGSATTCLRWPGRATPSSVPCTTSCSRNCGHGCRRAHTGSVRSTDS